MPKMHQNTFGDQTPPGLAVGAWPMRFPDSISRNGGLLVMRIREGEGPISKGNGGREGTTEGTEREVKGSRISSELILVAMIAVK